MIKALPKTSRKSHISQIRTIIALIAIVPHDEYFPWRHSYRTKIVPWLHRTGNDKVIYINAVQIAIGSAI